MAEIVIDSDVFFTLTTLAVITIGGLISWIIADIRKRAKEAIAMANLLSTIQEQHRCIQRLERGIKALWYSYNAMRKEFHRHQIVSAVESRDLAHLMEKVEGPAKMQVPGPIGGEEEDYEKLFSEVPDKD